MKSIFVKQGSAKLLVILVDKGVDNITFPDLDIQQWINYILENKYCDDKQTKVFTSVFPAGYAYKSLLLIKTGTKNLANSKLVEVEQLGGKICEALSKNSCGFDEADIFIPDHITDKEEFAARLSHGFELRNYKFNKYKTNNDTDKEVALETVHYIVNDKEKATLLHAELSCISEGVFMTRDLVTEPGNILYPETMVEKCKEMKKLGLDVEILNHKDMEKLGMGALLGVAQGSIREPYLIILKWNGAADKNEQPVAFVGKGVTFDTGGISLKPAGSMVGMKYDMGGSAVVIGLLRTLALRDANVNAIGVIGAVENMPDAAAQRPDDVVTTMSGQTVEVLNTDAEGRLVLADALWYCQDRFKPQFIVDLATLTGAMVVALGSVYGGMFSNNDEISQKLQASGEETGELVWRLPLHKDYDDMLKSDIADMPNISKGGEAGSITAAQFLQKFVNNVPWVHLDIAGVNWSKTDKALSPKGATAYGVRLLNNFIAKYYEK